MIPRPSQPVSPPPDDSQLELTAITDAAPHPLREAFDSFHAENPHVYAELRKLALRIEATGRKRYSIQTLFEVLRWRRDLVTNPSADGFKLNNNYRPFYARLLMDREPRLQGFFEKRQAVADRGRK